MSTEKMSDRDEPAILKQILRSRRTIGAFRSELPPREIILDALEVARWAPNHKKTEPWHVYWLGTETQRAVIELNGRIVTEHKGPVEAESKRKKWAAVPGWLVITCDLADNALRREEDYAACACFIHNLSLSLWSHGIGTKWSTGDVVRHPSFAELVGFDPGQQRVVGLLWYGYPEIIPQQTRRDVATFLQERP